MTHLLMSISKTCVALAVITAAFGCGEPAAINSKSQAILDMKRATDFHSYSQPEEAVVTHLNWNASVNFEDRIIRATAIYDIETSKTAERILLDCVDLTIEAVTVDGKPVEWSMGPTQEFIGQPLSIPVQPSSKRVSIRHHTWTHRF